MSDKIDKLSAAIRIGAKAGKQLKHNYADNDFNSCALGAAGIGLSLFMPDKLDKTYNWTKIRQNLIDRFDGDKIISNPKTGEMNTIICTIIYLNDHSNWTREKIADWLESIGR